MHFTFINSEFEKNLKSGSKQEAELNYDLELKVLVELKMFEGITEKGCIGLINRLI